MDVRGSYTDTILSSKGGDGYPKIAAELALFFEVDVLHVVDGMSEESLPETAKFLDRIGGKKPQAGLGAAFLAVGNRRWNQLPQMRCDGARCGIGRVDDSDMRGCNPVEQRLEQRIVRASQNEDVGVGKTIGERLIQVDAGYLFSDRVLYPSFFDEGHK